MTEIAFAIGYDNLQVCPLGAVDRPASGHIDAASRIPLATLPIAAQTPVSASGDTVVLIVKSPLGAEVSFSGNKRGQVWGTMYRGPLLLYFAPGQGFGFGDRNAAKRVVP